MEKFEKATATALPSQWEAGQNEAAKVEGSSEGWKESLKSDKRKQKESNFVKQLICHEFADVSQIPKGKGAQLNMSFNWWKEEERKKATGRPRNSDCSTGAMSFQLSAYPLSMMTRNEIMVTLAGMVREQTIEEVKKLACCIFLLTKQRILVTRNSCLLLWDLLPTKSYWIPSRF